MYFAKDSGELNLDFFIELSYSVKFISWSKLTSVKKSDSLKSSSAL